MKTYTVYYHTFPNGKMYFGQTCLNVKRRWRNKGEGYKKQKLLYSAIKKYCWDNIDHRIISIGLDKDEADFQEMFYISAYRTNEIEFGYNLTKGGEGRSESISEETKKKLSEANKGKKLSEETINKMRSPKPKFKWLTPDGSIREMDMRNVKVFHKDWIQIKE